MNLMEAASIVSGLAIGYWLISAFTKHPDDANHTAEQAPQPETVADETDERPWYQVLEVSEWANQEEVTAAYRSKITLYHPDKVATMGPEIRALAELKARELNTAYRQANRK